MCSIKLFLNSKKIVCSMAKEQSRTHFVWDQCKLVGVVCTHNMFFVPLIDAVLVLPLSLLDW